MSALFSSLDLGPLTLCNRIVIAPMCQYSCLDGNAGDWHFVHLNQLAMSGAGLLIIEATAVEDIGRITLGDLGLYSDDNEAALAHVLEAMRRFSSMPIGIQLGHAGRKASSHVPWQGGASLKPEEGAWTTCAPSALPHAQGEPAPVALDDAGLARIKAAFVQAAKRAQRLGVQLIELHAAHGYLLHQFLSPVSNQRTDAYGGSLENRMRFPLEVFDAVRAAVSRDVAVGLRISATDWLEGEAGLPSWDVEQSAVLATEMAQRGADFIHVSSGGVSPLQKIALGPGYQVPFARRIRQACGLPTIAVGLITEPAQAEAVIAEGDADAIAIARTILFEPHWPWRAAGELGASVEAPPQYWRSQPRDLKAVFGPDARIGQR
ncbi:NADH:flavin oxidoreductase/NADH oxidase [Variovorax dokdonensis]|uniref:NADH:flavin oxidoreductase/NADH oxidase n=1 Tax=Variovorax dokdonensis TaxID=344883 RepID=A0ABT7NA34_9BURK|nr:NADH:flavin oxidoreductase/NADH oxidase [Variovorax dokdonensis]MDM0044787.1 NADH:flavin oxidoreductase/NADH oxidase [Variovorax dokdonensis]